MTEDTKQCPYCGGEIPVNAKKCKHCGEWLVIQEKDKPKASLHLAGWLEAIICIISAICYFNIGYSNGFVLGLFLIYVVLHLYFLPTFFSSKEIIILFTIISLIFILLIYLYFYQKNLFIDIFSTSIYYRLDRITSFKNQNNMQVNNALISIASGKLLYFPEANNDFFFAYLVSKNYWNFCLIIFSYLGILISLLSFKTPLSNLVFYLILFPVIENIGMNLSLFPVIGIPLPFLSYGGSHTTISFLFLALGLKKLNNNHNMN